MKSDGICKECTAMHEIQSIFKEQQIKLDSMKFLLPKVAKKMESKRGQRANVIRSSCKCVQMCARREKKVKILYHYSMRFHYRLPFYNFKHHTNKCMYRGSKKKTTKHRVKKICELNTDHVTPQHHHHR